MDDLFGKLLAFMYLIGGILLVFAFYTFFSGQMGDLSKLTEASHAVLMQVDPTAESSSETAQVTPEAAQSTPASVETSVKPEAPVQRVDVWGIVGIVVISGLGIAVILALLLFLSSHLAEKKELALYRLTSKVSVPAPTTSRNQGVFLRSRSTASGINLGKSD